MGYDDGSGVNNHPGIEAMRKGILTWKSQVDKSLSDNKKVEK